MILVYAREIDVANGSKHLRLVRFPLDGGKKGICHASRTSFTCWYPWRSKNKAKGILWHCRVFDPAHPEPFSNDLVKEPCVEIADIWEFYEIIGYDYKKQKWA